MIWWNTYTTIIFKAPVLGDMETNVGGLDRTLRLTVGPLLLAAGLATLAEILPFGATVGAIAVVIGLVFLVTGTTRKCVLNRLIGLDTSK